MEVKNICLEALERHCDSGAPGRLDFRRGAYEGQIFVQGCLIVHAQLAGLEGVPALFRLFDWGDAETTWQPGYMAEQMSLHLTMEAACVLYAEHLAEMAELESREKDRIDEALSSPELLAGQAGALDSVLKHYTISLECADPTLLPGGFTFADSTKSSYVIGSGEDCDVVLRHPTIEPLHCGVILEKGSVLIWDLGAQSGVKVNGVPIMQDILKVGDVMMLGAVELQVHFQLRRPNINRPKIAGNAPTGPLPLPSTRTLPMPKGGAPTKSMPKGPITFDKVNAQLKGTDKAKPFLKKLGSFFGSKDNK